MGRGDGETVWLSFYTATNGWFEAMPDAAPPHSACPKKLTFMDGPERTSHSNAAKIGSVANRKYLVIGVMQAMLRLKRWTCPVKAKRTQSKIEFDMHYFFLAYSSRIALQA